MKVCVSGSTPGELLSLWLQLAAKKRLQEPQDAEQILRRGESLYASGHYSDAAAFLEKSADLGNTHAQYLLGSMHQFGYGVEKNYNEAIKLYRKSIEDGYTKALPNLAWLYATHPSDVKVNISGDEALSFALQAVEEDPIPVNFDTLAAVYARNGQFDKAIEAENEAISLNENTNAEFVYRLKLYEDAKPYILD